MSNASNTFPICADYVVFSGNNAGTDGDIHLRADNTAAHIQFDNKLRCDKPLEITSKITDVSGGDILSLSTDKTTITHGKSTKFNGAINFNNQTITNASGLQGALSTADITSLNGYNTCDLELDNITSTQNTVKARTENLTTNRVMISNNAGLLASGDFGQTQILRNDLTTSQSVAGDIDLASGKRLRYDGVELVGFTQTQANAITANTAKIGITTQQATDITTNNAKTGITTEQAAAIVSNSAKVGITPSQASQIVSNTTLKVDKSTPTFSGLSDGYAKIASNVLTTSWGVATSDLTGTVSDSQIDSMTATKLTGTIATARLPSVVPLYVMTGTINHGTLSPAVEYCQALGCSFKNATETLTGAKTFSLMPRFAVGMQIGNASLDPTIVKDGTHALSIETYDSGGTSREVLNVGQSIITIDDTNLLMKTGDVWKGASISGDGLFARVGALESDTSATELKDPAGNQRVQVLNSGVNIKTSGGTSKVAFNESTTDSFYVAESAFNVFSPSGTTIFSINAYEASDTNISLNCRCSQHFHDTLRVDGNATMNGDVEVDTAKDFKKEGVAYGAFSKLADLETRLSALETPKYTATSNTITFQPKSSGYDSNSLLFDSSTLWSKNGATGAVLANSDDNFFTLKMFGPTVSTGGGSYVFRLLTHIVLKQETNDSNSAPIVDLPVAFYHHASPHSESPTLTFVPKPLSSGWEVHFHQGGLDSNYTPDTAQFSLELVELR